MTRDALTPTSKPAWRRSAAIRTSLKFLPGALVVAAETLAEAQAKRTLLDSLVHPDSGMGSLSIALGCDASRFDLDAELPEIPETNQSKSGRHG